MNTPAPRVTKAEVTDLLTFLGANIDVSIADGKPEKAGKYREFQTTVQGLVAMVGVLPDSASPAATDRRDIDVAADDADVHIYFDISGSVDIDGMFKVIEAEIERVKAAAGLARRPIRVWFTPFTHEIIPGDHSMKVWSAFPNSEELRQHLSEIPLRGGGTDFQLVWRKINTDPDKSARRNVIVSDLEWWTTAEIIAQEQPVNIEYAVTPKAHARDVSRFEEMLRLSGRRESTPIRFY